MKRMAMLLAVSFAPFVIGGANARADSTGVDLDPPEYYVVTIYFAGTNCTSEMWNMWYGWDQPPTNFGAHNGPWKMWQFFGQEEGLSALHHYHLEGVQQAPSGVKLHHRTRFVNGVGWEAEIYWNWGQRVADINDPARAGAYRGWNWVIYDQALAYLDGILAEVALNPDIDGVILNTAGFSRGAVTAMWFANLAARNFPVIKKINILAFDPVPGWYWDDIRVAPHNFDFSAAVFAKVNQYVGMYARDENSGKFWVLVPVGLQNRTLMFTLPGAHETLVGSKAVLAHSEHNYCCCLNDFQCSAGWPQCWWSEIAHDDHPGWIGRLSSLIASQFLRSPEWGAAQFLPEWYHSGTYIDSFATFSQKFYECDAGHLPYNYWWMRTVGFTPALDWPSCLDQVPWGQEFERRAIVPNVADARYDPVHPNILAKAPLWPYHRTTAQVLSDIQPMLGGLPQARAGASQTIVVSHGDEGVVTLDGSDSWDPDGDLLLYYEWHNLGDPGQEIASGHDVTNPQITLPLGEHQIRLRLYDGYHGVDSYTYVKVIPECPVDCPDGAYFEEEMCGAEANNGCSMDTPAFEEISFDDTVCGTLWGEGGAKDSDWYQFTLDERRDIDFSGESALPIHMHIRTEAYPSAPPCELTGFGTESAEACASFDFHRNLPAGTYWLVVEPMNAEQFGCERPVSDYWIEMSPCDQVLYADDDAPPNGDGLSWDTAYDNLQVALAAACAVTEIRVAGGTYTPGPARHDTFQLVNGVTLSGGYRGLAGGGDPNERDIAAFETILSGDIGLPGVPTDNTYTVVTGSYTDAEAVIDGFTVADGYADGGGQWAGGMLNVGGSPTIHNCTFRGNVATWAGGAMYNRDTSSPTLANCVFSGNSGGEWGGGGMANVAVSNPTLINCVFSGNSAALGAAMRNYGYSNPTLINCGFHGNTATNSGGGMHNMDSASPTVTNSILWGNTPDEFHNVDTSAPVVTNSCVEGGYAGDGNIGELPEHDPLFVDTDGGDDVPGTADDNLRLQPGSPCINAGDNDAPGLPATDLDGRNRILCGVVDMGAYESAMGDHECDGDVGLGDFASWEACMTGPNSGPYPEGCEAFDFEYDEDVDLDDFASFQTVFTAEQ